LNETVTFCCVEPLHDTLFSAQLPHSSLETFAVCRVQRRSVALNRSRILRAARVPYGVALPTNAATCWHKTGAGVQSVSPKGRGREGRWVTRASLLVIE
jgi:hypothetical protein